MSLGRQEIRKLMAEVIEDCKNFPRHVREEQLREAGWTSDSAGEIWLPPHGTVPYRPYLRYGAWKRMRELQAVSEGGAQ